MANPRFAWGVDIGNRALKAIKLVREGDNLRMEDIEVIEHDQVLSNSGDNRESLIQTALANFSQRHTTKGGVVSVGVSGQSSFARFIKLPPVEEKKIPEIVRFEAIQQIPFPLESVEWSYQLFRQPDSPDVEVGIFAMRKELVNQQIRYFTDMDMNVQVVQMNPLAVYNAMYYDGRLADGTTMILDLGAENADLIIADGESVWLRSIAIGGNNFTEALVKAFKLNFNKAEELKRNAQTSKYARQIFQAMRPIFADLVAEIQRSIGFYSSVHRDSRIKKIIALGNTFRLPTLQKYLQQNLQIQVERLDHFGAGAPDDGRLAALLSDNIASMAGAYGLALQAMGQGKIGSSLLPHEIRRAKVWQEKTKWFGAAAAVCVLAAGVKFGVYYWHNTRMNQNQDVARINDQIVAKAVKFDSDWAAVQSAGEPDKKRIQNVNQMKTYRDFWGDLWLDLTKSLPPDNAAPAEKLKATKRSDRQQIFIDKIDSVYYPSIDPILALGENDFKKLSVGGNNPNMPVMPAAVPSDRGPVAPPVSPQRFGGERRGSLIEEEMGVSRGRAMATAPPPPPVDSGDPNASAGGGKRGFLIELHCTSPNKDASTLVETALCRELVRRVAEPIALKEGKTYYVARAMLIQEQQLKDNQERRSQLMELHQRKKAAQERAQQALQEAQGGGGGSGGAVFPSGGGGGGIFNRGAGGGGGGIRYDDAGRPIGGGGRGQSFGGGRRSSIEEEMGGRGRYVPPAAGGYGRAPAANAEEEAKNAADAYNDPITGESQLDDWELKVLIAVVLDPQSAPEGATEGGTGTTTGTDGAAAPAQPAPAPVPARQPVPAPAPVIRRPN
jgi:type IV pilus assembly protein PilM